MSAQDDIKKQADVQSRLQVEFNKLVTQEAALLDEVGDSVLAGSSEKTIGALAELRGRKEAVAQAILRAKAKIQQTRDEAEYNERAAIAGQWPGIDKVLSKRLAKIREMTGKDGLTGEFELLAGESNAADPIANKASQDAQTRVRAIRNLSDIAIKHLSEIRILLENIEHLN